MVANHPMAEDQGVNVSSQSSLHVKCASTLGQRLNTVQRLRRDIGLVGADREEKEKRVAQKLCDIIQHTIEEEQDVKNCLESACLKTESDVAKVSMELSIPRVENESSLSLLEQDVALQNHLQKPIISTRGLIIYRYCGFVLFTLLYCLLLFLLF